MRKLIAAASTAVMMLALTAAPAMAQPLVGPVQVGANVCDVNAAVLVDEFNDAAAEEQCTVNQTSTFEE